MPSNLQLVQRVWCEQGGFLGDKEHHPLRKSLAMKNGGCHFAVRVRRPLEMVQQELEQHSESLVQPGNQKLESITFWIRLGIWQGCYPTSPVL